MKNLIEAYLQYLANHPGRVDSIILWTISMVFVYIILFMYRKKMIEGASGEDTFFQLPEQVNYLLHYVWPPITFYAAYFDAKFQVYVWVLILGIIAYLIGGRWIFEWVLALRSGKANVEIKETTTTTIKES